jgi:hypothetical protein
MEKESTNKLTKKLQKEIKQLKKNTTSHKRSQNVKHPHTGTVPEGEIKPKWDPAALYF